MSNQTGFLTILVMLLLVSCNKEPVELTIQNEPLFKVDVLLGGDSLLIEAGRGGYYMFTDNGERENNSYYDPISSFAKEAGCQSDCKESFSIEFKDFGELDLINFFKSPGTATNDSQIYPFHLIGPNPNESFEYEISLEDRSFFSGSSFNSDIGWTSSASNIAPVALIDTFPTLDFDVTIIQSLGDPDNIICSGSYTQSISLDQADQCFIDLDFSLGADSILVVSNGNANLSFNWDDTTEGGSLFIPEDGTYCLTVTSDALGCVNERCITVYHLGQADMSYCSPAFSYRVVPIQLTTGTPGDISPTVAISYINKDGNEYRSDLLPQSSSRFIISQTSGYEPNSNGQPTSLLRAVLNCTLFNDNGEELILNDGKLVFALALP